MTWFAQLTALALASRQRLSGASSKCAASTLFSADCIPLTDFTVYGALHGFFISTLDDYILSNTEWQLLASRHIGCSAHLLHIQLQDTDDSQYGVLNE